MSFMIFNLVLDKKYSISHPLISLTDKIREQLHSGNFACGIFVDPQKLFGTVDHDILIQNLTLYDIRRVANNCFPWCIRNRLHYVSINGFHSNLKHIHCGVPQGSILGRLLFSIYLNDLNRTTRYCSVHHFADDTNLSNYNNSVNRMKKHVTKDFKNLTNWLNVNKIVYILVKLNLMEKDFTLLTQWNILI